MNFRSLCKPIHGEKKCRDIQNGECSFCLMDERVFCFLNLFSILSSRKYYIFDNKFENVGMKYDEEEEVNMKGCLVECVVPISQNNTRGQHCT